MRVLAVDYGERRIGLAACDALEITANPLRVLERRGSLEEAADAVARVAADEGAEEIVVGIPVNADGSHGPSAQAAQAFADALAARVAVPVRGHNEFLTTVEAESQAPAPKKRRGSGRRPPVDQLAAAVILRDYLRSQGRMG